MGFTVLGLGPNSLKEGCIGEYIAECVRGY